MTAPEFYCTDCETMMPVDISGRGACGHGRMIRADLAAVQPAQVRVKPLVWTTRSGAPTAFGNYIVTCEDHDDVTVWFVLFGGKALARCGEHRTEYAAKAAAQADYETRILAALEPQPDPRDEQRRALEKVIRNQRVQIKRLAATAEAHWRFVNRVREERLADPRNEVIARLVEAAKPFAQVRIKDGVSQAGDIGRTDVTNIRAALAAAKAVQHG